MTERIMIMFAWILLFTLFDCIVFPEALKGNWIGPYRILQFTVQFVLSFTLWQFQGWKPIVGANIAWYFLACDVLYYVLKRVQLEPFTWFTPSPFVFYFVKIKQQPCPVWAVELSAAIGLVAGILICI